MLLEALRAEVLAANLSLPQLGLVRLTWGNVSGIDRERGLVVIKPSGVPYATMTVEDLVVVDLEGGVVEGERRPSSDTATHLVLYRGLPEVGGVVHTHSTYATAFAQAERPVPLLGTTHADFAPGAVPLARHLRHEEIADAYEQATGDVLLEAVGDAGASGTPGVLVPGHGPFVWAESATKAVENAATLEEVAKMALLTLTLDPGAHPLAPALSDKHFSRKHGPGAYYGQPAPGGTSGEGGRG